MIKGCLNCEREYYTEDKRNKYCNRKCYFQYKQLKTKEKWMPILTQIYNEYLKEEKSLKELMSKYYKKYGLINDRNTLANLLRKYGFKLRSKKEANKLIWKQRTPEQKRKQIEAAHKRAYKGVAEKNFRKRVFKFYPNICVMCGETDIKKLDAHHRIPQERNSAGYPTGNGDHRVRNGMIICKKCHAKIHNQSEKAKEQYKNRIKDSKGRLR